MVSFSVNTNNYKKEIKNAVEKNLYLLNKSILKNKKIFIESYKEQILKIIKELINLQKEHKVESIGTLIFVLSRINIDNEVLEYKINVYGEKVYIDSYKCCFNINVSNIYKYFIELKHTSHKEINKYLGIIERCNVNSDLYEYLKYYNMYVVNLLREVFSTHEVQSTLKEINKYSDFYILQNEIYEKPYLIYH